MYRLPDTNHDDSLLELTRKSGLGVSFETIGRALRASSRYVRWAKYKPHICPKGESKRIR